MQEAQFFADSKKFEDINYAVPISENKFSHAVKLMKQIKRFIIVVDSNFIVDKLEEYAQKIQLDKKWLVYLMESVNDHMK